ncbi:hypothetical protein TNCV_1147461 [Trichonephila clavipes]|nr:hypothetical protein TNCV_1147461 [Trichonephila clavipes]
MLKRVIVTEWNTISSEETSKLAQSMPKRLTEVQRLVKARKEALKFGLTVDKKQTRFPILSALKHLPGLSLNPSLRDYGSTGRDPSPLAVV